MGTTRCCTGGQGLLLLLLLFLLLLRPCRGDLLQQRPQQLTLLCRRLQCHRCLQRAATFPCWSECRKAEQALAVLQYSAAGITGGMQCERERGADPDIGRPQGHRLLVQLQGLIDYSSLISLAAAHRACTLPEQLLSQRRSRSCCPRGTVIPDVHERIGRLHRLAQRAEAGSLKPLGALQPTKEHRLPPSVLSVSIWEILHDCVQDSVRRGVVSHQREGEPTFALQPRVCPAVPAAHQTPKPSGHGWNTRCYVLQQRVRVILPQLMQRLGQRRVVARGRGHSDLTVVEPFAGRRAGRRRHEAQSHWPLRCAEQRHGICEAQPADWLAVDGPKLEPRAQRGRRRRRQRAGGNQRNGRRHQRPVERQTELGAAGRKGDVDDLVAMDGMSWVSDWVSDNVRRQRRQRHQQRGTLRTHHHVLTPPQN